jgi:hypothetical protein
MRRARFRRVAEAIGPWLDKWGPRLSNIAQVGLCAIAAWGLIYTVIPLYRLSVTDNELAQKTLELAKTNAALARAYIAERRVALAWYVKVIQGRCTGLIPADFDARKERLHWRDVLSVDVSKCANEHLAEDGDLAQLNQVDRGLIRAELSRALQDIGTWQQEGRVKCEALETAPADQLPELPPPAPGSFSATLDELLRSANYHRQPPSAAERRVRAQDNIADAIEFRTVNRLSELSKIKWSSTPD